MSAPPTRSLTIPRSLAGTRLDQALATLFPEYSRARLAQWIRDGHALIDDGRRRPRDRVAGGERVTLRAEPPPADERWRAEALPLAVVYADEHLLVVDKPAGVVVHPGAGNRSGTLLNALLHHDPGLAHVPRAGLVHRLDKDTSGLLVVARTLPAHSRLAAALRQRTVTREYQAVVRGRPSAGGRVDAPLGRHPVKRTRMAVVGGGRPALTHFRVLARYRAHSHVLARLDTGRTHQIRVHMAHIGHPLVGDPAYGGRLGIPAGAGERLAACLRAQKRQALHAAALALSHPVSGESMRWDSPLPADMRALLEALAEDAEGI
ncbi:MAG: 23S rRNA pseudouridine(1911/1915/1917) synthase RluD [Gammaproteobacteria bacterium]|nr:23S rRNA pseudouridine(1911/1915/1917) synthase RluD [Gammaproteobacteria bacterium]